LESGTPTRESVRGNPVRAQRFGALFGKAAEPTPPESTNKSLSLILKQVENGSSRGGANEKAFRLKAKRILVKDKKNAGFTS